MLLVTTGCQTQTLSYTRQTTTTKIKKYILLLLHITIPWIALIRVYKHLYISKVVHIIYVWDVVIVNIACFSIYATHTNLVNHTVT